MSYHMHNLPYEQNHLEFLLLVYVLLVQRWTSSIKSTFCMELLPSFAPQVTVLRCLLDQSMKTFSFHCWPMRLVWHRGHNRVVRLCKWVPSNLNFLLPIRAKQNGFLLIPTCNLFVFWKSVSFLFFCFRKLGFREKEHSRCTLCYDPASIHMLTFLGLTYWCRYEYRWADGVTIKKPIEVSAPKYVEYLMDWIEAQLDDEAVFPQRLGEKIIVIFTSIEYIYIYIVLAELFLMRDIWIFIRFCMTIAGAPFPSNFKDVVKTIFKRLFRVYAHIYHSHFQKIVSLKEEAHLNTCFKHFVLFTWVRISSCDTISSIFGCRAIFIRKKNNYVRQNHC